MKRKRNSKSRKIQDEAKGREDNLGIAQSLTKVSSQLLDSSFLLQYESEEQRLGKKRFLLDISYKNSKDKELETSGESKVMIGWWPSV